MAGQSGEYGNRSSGYFEIPGMGLLNVVDLGSRKLDQYTNPGLPWTQLPLGGVIRYRGLDAYFRYSGAGRVEVTVDAIGSISLHFDQGVMIVNVADLEVK
jgi:hypothetical protein